MGKIAVSLLLFTVVLFATEKKPPIEETSNELVDITATLLDADQVHQELGSGLDPSIVVVRVMVRPVTDKPIPLSPDDFLLVSGKDGQRSEPFAPGQIAGSEAIAMTTSNGGFKHNRPTLGGMVGIGGGGLGSSPGTNSVPELKGEATHEKPNPLLDALKAKELPEKQITETVSGLLYFQSVGKVKPKDLELRLKGIGSPLALRFRP